jgi:hypothetical protein
MKKLPILLAPFMLAALVVASCDNNIPPTKAPGAADPNPQVDKSPVLKSTNGGDQPGTPPAQ